MKAVCSISFEGMKKFVLRVNEKKFDLTNCYVKTKFSHVKMKYTISK